MVLYCEMQFKSMCAIAHKLKIFTIVLLDVCIIALLYYTKAFETGYNRISRKILIEMSLNNIES